MERMELIAKQVNGQSGGDGNFHLRTCRIEIRVSPVELKKISENTEKSGFANTAQFLRTIALHGLRAENPHSVRRALVKAQGQLSRIGNNLNQIARRINSGHPIDDEVRLYLAQIAEHAEDYLKAVHRHDGGRA